MICIYQAANLADAHLVRQLLALERIDAYIAGEYLQGALGEIPANTPIEVRVAPEDAARARRIVEDWRDAPIDASEFDDESENASENESEGQSKPAYAASRDTGLRVFSAVAWLFGGAAIGAGLVWAAYNGPKDETGIDYDGDGVQEDVFVYRGGALQRVETDRNRDRRPDQTFYYDLRGRVERFESDDDFDGAFETQTEYLNGQPALTKIDRDRDGRPEYRIEYLRGVLYREEWLDAGANVTKRIEYRAGVPFAGEFDRDGDGRLDIERRYDARGEIVGSDERSPR